MMLLRHDVPILPPPLVLALALLLLAPTAACQTQSGGPSASGPQVEQARSDHARIESPVVAPDDQAELVRGNTAFALDVYGHIRNQAGNVFFSPHSISLALAMAYAGAEGDTATQMAAALHYTLPADRLHPAFNWLDQALAGRNQLASADQGQGFTLRVANAAWGQVDFSFASAYLDLLAENYGAGLNLVDFADAETARQTINDWVAAQTEQKILDLLPPGSIDALTRLVLTNAIYFLAPWEHPFDPDNTHDGAFQRRDGSSVTTAMMNQTESFGYATGDGWTAVELPYNGHQLSMVCLVPDAGTLDAFESGLDATRLGAILDALAPARLDLTMPRFTFSYALGLVPVLQALGMVDAFDSNAANFDGIAPSAGLYISNVLHKAFLSVDEAGTEAAAATAVIVGTTSVPPPPIEVRIDRPFVFLIRDIPTGAILFVGRLVDPT